MARVLIVEDDFEVQQLLARRLRSYGHQVITAPNGRFAVVAVGFDFAPEVVVIDVGLRGMNGFDVLARLRRHPELGNPCLPAVFLSDCANRQDMERARSLGARYLLRPFVSGALNGAVLAAAGVSAQ